MKKSKKNELFHTVMNRSLYLQGDESEAETEDSEEDLPSDSAIRQIVETGSITVSKDGHLIHCLTIIGQIEGHYILPAQNKTTKYEHVIPQLVAIEESSEIEGLIVILDTVGGGHSIGVPLAVSAKKSFIVPSATMTVHPVRMNGLVLGVPQTFSYFQKMQERIVEFVTRNSAMTAERFREYMLATGELATDVGSVLDGKTAVESGMIDCLGGLSDALHCLYGMITEK